MGRREHEGSCTTSSFVVPSASSNLRDGGGDTLQQRKQADEQRIGPQLASTFPRLMRRELMHDSRRCMSLNSYSRPVSASKRQAENVTAAASTSRSSSSSDGVRSRTFDATCHHYKNAGPLASDLCVFALLSVDTAGGIKPLPSKSSHTSLPA